MGGVDQRISGLAFFAKGHFYYQFPVDLHIHQVLVHGFGRHL